MKKWLIGIVLLIGIIIAVRQFSQNDYTSAKQLANTGNYQGFYAAIKDDVAKGDENAANILMHYFLKAVQSGDVEKVKYFLDLDQNLINMSDENGARAMDAALVADVVNKNMIQILLSYKPELNYKIKYFKNMSLLQMIALNNNLSNGSELAKDMIDHGADVNYHDTKGDTGNSALLLSYSSDNLEVFKVLIQHGAIIDDRQDLLGLIAGSYVLELKKRIPKLKAIYSTPLSSEIIPIINSQSYRMIHSRNIAYLTLIFQAKKISEMGTPGLSKLAQFYAATNEVEGMQMLVANDLCQYKVICADAIQKATLNNNRAILSLLNQ